MPAGFRASFLPVASRSVSVTALHTPMGSDCIPDASVTDHGDGDDVVCAASGGASGEASAEALSARAIERRFIWRHPKSECDPVVSVCLVSANDFRVTARA